MVEAALIFPAVLITVLIMLVVSLLKFQEDIVKFGTQKMASQMAREAAYPGYNQYIGSSNDMSIDISGSGIVDVDQYYSKRKLYGAFGRNHKNVADSFAEKTTKFMYDYAFLVGLSVKSKSRIAGILAPTAELEVEYGIRLPHFVAYLNVPEHLTMRTASYAFASNPTEFVRNVDIAVDLIDFLLDKLGLKDKVDVFLEKMQNMIDKFGG